jgi:hypothetical protein
MNIELGDNAPTDEPKVSQKKSDCLFMIGVASDHCRSVK